MKAIKIKTSWLSESGLRLDAPFHLSDGVKTKRLIEKFCPYKLSSVSEESLELYKGNIHKRVYVSSPNFGHTFYTASDLFKSDLETGKYVSKKYSVYLKELELKKNWILITRSGTLGKVLLTSEDHEKKIGTDDLIRISLKEKNIKTGYLYSFLSSKYGYGLLTQSGYGGVVKHIEPDHVGRIMIPILPTPFQNKVSDLMLESTRIRVEGNKLLREALSEIESQFSFIKAKTNYSVNIKDILNGDKYTTEARLESDYYQPATKYLESQILDMPHALLGDLSEDVSISNLRGRIFVNKGVTLVTGQSLGLLKPDLSKQLSKKLTRNIDKNLTLEGDILVSAFGTLGKVEYCYKNFYTSVFASQQLVRIRVDSEKIDEGYLYLFLRSRIGQSLIQKFKTGSVIEWANWNNFCSILVPIPNDRGKRLGETAREVVVKFQQAYTLESQAIELVEQEIASWEK